MGRSPTDFEPSAIVGGATGGRLGSRLSRLESVATPVFEDVGETISGGLRFRPMSEDEPRLRTRLIFGAIAGFAATAAMTSAMWRLHSRLPPSERYPLPPKEITQQVTSGGSDSLVRDQAMAAHFAYGAATGALVTALKPGVGPFSGAVAGVGIWAGSYFGWVPGFNILAPANRHPARRNALMITVHLIWGAATALSYRELIHARATILRDGPHRDAKSR